MCWLVLLLALVWASPVWAVEGGAARPAGDTNPSSYSKGSHLVQEFFLCDGPDDPNTATETCADFDVIDIAGGFPDYISFDLIGVANCSGAVAVTVRGKNETGGETSDITVLTAAGTDQFIAYPIPNRIFDATAATATGCDDIEVLIKLYIRKRQ